MSETQNKPYVFVSYAHKDSAVVFPCIEALKQNNVNIWFDEGIQAGSEWPEYIAEKVMSCTKFVLFISKAYLESQNCKRELNFAISKKKDLLSVFIEDVELSPGVEMQLGTYQSIMKNRFANEAAFHTSLSQEQWFNSCKNAGTQDFSDLFSGLGYRTTQKPQSTAAPQKATSTPTAKKPNNPTNKNRIAAILLAFFFGSLGIHQFYLGNKTKGILSLLFFWTYIPFFASMVSFFSLIFMSDAKFDQKYNNKV